MERETFGVAVTPEIVDKLDELVEEYADFGAGRSESIETILPLPSLYPIHRVLDVLHPGNRGVIERNLRRAMVEILFC